MGESTGAGVIFGVTGGVIEAAVRTAYELFTGKKLQRVEFTELRGMEGVRSATIDFDGLPVNIGIATDLVMRESCLMMSGMENRSSMPLRLWPAPEDVSVAEDSLCTMAILTYLKPELQQSMKRTGKNPSGNRMRIHSLSSYTKSSLESQTVKRHTTCYIQVTSTRRRRLS
jgi:hypothetical protein